ncbi:MAG: DM13 domain-containing protein [Rhizonema sp. NSF051]|nr:DM13 domain-containing protein [Rhizonema sp. NSF051]
MKFKHIAVLGFATLLTVGSIKEVVAQKPASTGSDIVAQAGAPATAPTTAPAGVPAGVPASTSASTPTGTFQAGEHPTQGTVSIVTENGKRYLVLSQDFQSAKGPDLHVIMYKTDAPPKGGLKKADYYILAPLKKISGTQRYAIPDKVNVANYKSVAIWCQKFNATFGYAPLSS